MDVFKTLMTLNKEVTEFDECWGFKKAGYDDYSSRDFFDYISQAKRIVDLQTQVLGDSIIPDAKDTEALKEVKNSLAPLLEEINKFDLSEDQILGNHTKNIIGNGVGDNKFIAGTLLDTINAQDSIVHLIVKAKETAKEEHTLEN